MTRTVTGRQDAALHARVVRTTELRYAAGADAALDRPAHLRAGSGIAWVGGRLAVVQDDAAFLAWIDPATGLADSLPLLRGADGARQFGDDRGNKHLKPDFESCVAVPWEGGVALLALGSGSAAHRDRIVVATGWREGTPSVRTVDAGALYDLLRATPDFAGSELNVEGAAWAGGRLRLFNRGNGAARGGLLPVDATCELDGSALLRWLADGGRGAPPPPADVVQLSLGALDGLRLTFTDAEALPDGRTLFAASAEDSPDATRDGRVAGSALGVIAGEDVRWTRIVGMGDGEWDGKVEGVVAVPGMPGRVFCVVDRDDPVLPSDLCEVEVRGVW